MRIARVLTHLWMLLLLAALASTARGDDPVDRYLVRKEKTAQLKEPLVLREIQRSSAGPVVTSWEIERDGTFLIKRGTLVKGVLDEDPSSRRSGRVDQKSLEHLAGLLAEQEFGDLPDSFGWNPKSSPRKLVIAFGPKARKTVYLRVPRTGDEDFYQSVMTTKAYDPNACGVGNETAKAYERFATIVAAVVHETAPEKAREPRAAPAPSVGN